MIHVALSAVLVLLLFKDKFVATKMNLNMFIILATVIFGLAAVRDITVGLLIAAISFVVISKVEVTEKFDVKKKEASVSERAVPASKPPASASKPPASASKPPAPGSKPPTGSASPPKPTVDVPKHCSNVGIRDDVLRGLTDKVDEYQSNTYDKYNMNVFYMEAGSNSMDIQGIFNHEVQGYERT